MRVTRSAATSPKLRTNELDVEVCRARARSEILRIRGDDSIAVVCQEHERRVDDIVLFRAGQELSRSTAQRCVQRVDVERVDCAREECLSWTTTEPCPADDAAVAHGNLAVSQRELQALPHRAIVSLECDQRAPLVQHR
ncbi:MAG: hypothetical protein ABI591_18860 [Kofleriaceae bacterium]